jgi:hypothetical protein
MTMSDWIPGNPNDRSIGGFCIRHGGLRGPMSRKFYNDLKKKDLGPRETFVDTKIIITVEAEAEWERARAEPGAKEQRQNAKIKAWRHRRSLKAGAAAAASPKHVSKQGRRKKKGAAK